jgi:exopolysaccharide biosynthesis polyprenyl glycosylphosphotransferase
MSPACEKLKSLQEQSNRSTWQCSATSSRSAFNRLVLGTLFVDWLIIVAALFGAHWLRFETSLSSFGVPAHVKVVHADYLGHLIIGVVLMVVILLAQGVYTRECLLSFLNTIRAIWKAALIWLLVYLSFTLILKFEPSVSRVFCVLGAVLLVVVLSVWRAILWRIIRSEKHSQVLRLRAIIVGWSDDFEDAIDRLVVATDRPFDIIGVVRAPEGESQAVVPHWMPMLGSFDSLESLLQMRVCQVVLVADNSISSGSILHIASVCEKEMVDFKLVPTYFRVLLSGLNLESVAGVPILGISRLPLHSTFDQFLKRGVDLAGGLLGLILSAPIIAVFAWLIHRESPGSVFYRQRRLGANGKQFDMIKLRSMRLDAEAPGVVGWTVKNDPRRLRIGGFMRKWNIDELPQFWNVVKGDMSLVGPRPERPELIEQFKESIPHYNARHNIKPGITGWAQVNGLRGDTDLSERVRFDLHYIENWNVMLDFQIMFLTMFKREGAC